jgi:hypothetical protein
VAGQWQKLSPSAELTDEAICRSNAVIDRSFCELDPAVTDIVLGVLGRHFDRAVLYQRYLAPRGIEELARLDIFSNPCRSQSISLARPWASGPFTSDELAFARALMPHLQRVATLHAHVESTTSIARTGIDALDGAQAPLLLLDAKGRVVHASAEADRLLHEADGLSAGETGCVPQHWSAATSKAIW